VIAVQPGGRDLRQARRVSDRDHVRERLAFTFGEWTRALEKPDWAAPRALSDEDYRSLIKWLRNKIADGGFPPSQNTRLLQLLAGYSRSMIAKHQLLANPVNPPITIGRNESRRTFANFREFVALRIWNEAFESQLILVGKQSVIDGRVLRGLTLWSAIARGTLCEPALVRALHLCLNTGKACLERSLGGQFAIRLTLPVMSDAAEANRAPEQVDDDGGIIPHNANIKYLARIANQTDKESAIRVHRWVPDALTLALIHRCLEAEALVEGRERTINVIRYALWSDRAPKAKYETLESLCRHAIWLADDRPDLRYSESLGEVARGAWSSMGLDDTGHALCIGSIGPTRKSSVSVVTASLTKSLTPATIDWHVYHQIRDAVARVGNRYPTRQKLRATLEAIELVCPQDTIEHLVLSWLIYLLNPPKPLASSTIATYHARITHRLIDVFEGQPIDQLDSSDWELVYRSIIDQVRTKASRGQIAGRLSQLHAFGVKSRVHNLPSLTDPLFTGSGPKMVRARHIPAPFLGAIVAVLPEFCQHNDALSETVSQALVLAYRCGLRLSEVAKLRIGDVEQSAEKTLFVLENRFGTNKSASARRQLPLAAMLAAHERAAFNLFERRRRLTGKPNDPLFAVPGQRDPISDKWLSQTVSHAMARAIGGEGWTFHHLRHAAVNNLFLVMEDETELAQEFSGWLPEQQREILAAVLGDVRARQKRYIAMATFVGHADPQETFESYVHLVEHVMAARRERQRTAPDLALYAAAMNRAPSHIARHATDQEMSNSITGKMGRWIVKTKADKGMKHSQKAMTARASTAPPKPENRIRPADCIIALEIIERGGTLEEASIASYADLALVVTWRENAKILAALTTKYGHPRLFTHDRVERNPADHEKRVLLLPTRPKRAVDRADCEAMFDHLRMLWANSSSRPGVQWWLRYTIENADPSNSGTAFRDPEDLGRYLAVFNGSPFAPVRWHLQIRLADHVDSSPWVASMPKGSTQTDLRSKFKQRQSLKAGKRRAKGHVRLHLNQLSENRRATNSRDTKRTARTIRYVSHLMAIMTGMVTIR
jgi:site-specific recombinase XerD